MKTVQRETFNTNMPSCIQLVLGFAVALPLVFGEGSVYVRWGSKLCGYTSQTVYSGVVGGGSSTQYGAAVNALCLTKETVYASKPYVSTYTYLYGAEYEVTPNSKHNFDVVCAVCLSSRAVSIMIPGTTSCPSGWIREYYGYLMAGHYSHRAGTEYLCVDHGLEEDHASHPDNDGKLFFYVKGACGSLPCPPYQNDQVVTCVVCSK